MDQFGNVIRDLQMHVAGATVRHISPFSALDVPTCTEPLPAEIRDTWVRPLYFGLEKPDVKQFWASHARLVTDELIAQLLAQFDWRARTVGALLVALSYKPIFEDQISRLLLRSDVCYAGAAYCIALAELNTPQAVSFLKEYLAYYLEHPELWFDQGSVMTALAYLDKRNGTHEHASFLPQWDRFVANKQGWDLSSTLSRFDQSMATVQALKAL